MKGDCCVVKLSSVVWTKTIFRAKPPFSNSSGMVWTSMVKEETSEYMLSVDEGQQFS